MASKSVCLILRDVIFRKSRSCICGKRYLSTSNVQETAKAVSFSKRTHTCGELRRSNVGEDVVLCGWLQYQRMGSFLVLRDWKGLVQAVISEDQGDNVLPQKAKIVTDVTKLPQECVVKVEGTVRERPQGQENKKMDTGEIEVLVKNLQVLNSCQQNLPFEVKQFHEVKESLRMKYRYLDIRQPAMQRNLRLRSSVIMKMREFLVNQHGFVDVETPTLFRRTPGGAKEFIVPSRMPGRFYSLPQSPQQFKQLLMVGGIDRYFQIARCYRDEGAKPDRQPEFTQVDIEMSFVDQEGVKSMVEGLLEHSWPTELGKLSLPFPRLSYKEVMSRFGVDKPDTRFGMELCDISKHLQSCSVPAIKEAVHSDSGSVQALCVPQASKYLSNKEVDSIIVASKENLSKGNVYSVKIKDDGIWQGGVAKTIDVEAMKSVSNQIAAQPGDIVVMATGDYHQPHSTLGVLRLKFAEALESKGIKVRKEDVYNFLWVEDFPLFLPKEDGTEGIESAHHPFTAPHPDDEHLLFTHPEQARSQHYDLVLNGAEIGGGSIRIHNSRLQTHVLQNILKEDSSQLTHLLEALDSGCPPHGGIALGLDRLMSIICNTDSIRDVIAFPKSHDGKDPMSGAPSEVAKEDLDLYNIKVKT